MMVNPDFLSDEFVPGTIHLVDLTGDEHAQHGSGGQRDIVLHPAPSNDPEDPLNWSHRRKLLATMCMFQYALCICICSSAIYAILQPIANVTDLTLANLNTGTGYMLLGFGWGCLVWQPLAMLYGKRPVYLLSTLVTAGIMVWAPYTTTNGEWIASKVLQGFFGAPAESLCEVTVTDIWFAHERGRWMAVYVLAIEGANCIAPIIGGFIAAGQDWKWVIYWCAIYAAAQFVFFFFFFEETNFDRSKPTNPSDVPTTKGHDDNQTADATESEDMETTTAGPEDTKAYCSHVEANSTIYKRKTYLDRIKIFQFKKFPKPKPLVSMVIRPLVFLTFPVIAYSGFCVGCYQMWLIVLNGTESLILSGPPYHFSTLVVGIPYAAAGVGVILGALFAGPFGDRFVIRMARRNKGIMEPEHRLWLIVICVFFLPFGNILWGVGAYYKVHWFGLCFAMGVIAFVTVVGVQVFVSYCVDTYQYLSGEAMITVILIRNTMLFGVNYGITPWVMNLGYKNAYILAAFLGLGQVLTFLIFIKWGKYLRRISMKRYRRYAQGSFSFSH